MRIWTDTYITNGRYNAQINTSDFTEAERIALKQFGEPVIDIGGTFTGYVARPGQTNTTISFSGGGGTGAAATPIISNGAVTSFTVTSGGTGYTVAPTVLLSAPPSGGVQATATAALSGTSVVSLAITNGGSGYTSPPIVTLSGGGGAGATVAANLSNGVISGLNITSGGSGYGSAPAITVSGNGTAAALTSVLTAGAVTGYVISSGGLGYNVVPAAVNFTLPSALRRIRSDFPVKQVFDLGDSLNADINAKFWSTTIVGLVEAARTALLANSPLFTGQSMITVT